MIFVPFTSRRQASWVMILLHSNVHLVVDQDFRTHFNNQIINEFKADLSSPWRSLAILDLKPGEYTFDLEKDFVITVAGQKIYTFS